MANYAHVLNGVVENVYRDIEDPAVQLPALHLAGVVFACDAEVERSWRYAEGVFSAPPPPPEMTAREKRRREYFAVLKVEAGDDPLIVLGDQVDKLIAQVEEMRAELGAKRTAEFTDLLTKIVAVKTKFPKAPS